jgi:hypothetical protein
VVNVECLPMFNSTILSVVAKSVVDNICKAPA